MSVIPANASRGLGQSKLPPVLPVPRPGQGAYLAGGGDSISNAYPWADDSKSFQRFAADYLGGKTYAAQGHDGQRTDQILSTYAADVIALHASIVTVEGGVNNVFQNTSVNTIVPDLQAMVSAAITDGSLVCYIPILPWTNGTNAQNQTIDGINATMIAWMQAAHPTHIVADARALVGQFRPGGDANNHWDIQPRYSYDGIHYPVAGYQALGEFFAQRILGIV